MYDLYAMAHTASYKKVKAFSASDLDHPKKFTNISSHNKLIRYKEEGMAGKGEDFNSSQEPLAKTPQFHTFGKQLSIFDRTSTNWGVSAIG